MESDTAKLVVQDWSSDQDIDANKPHCHRNVHTQSVVLNNRFYVFQNVSPTNPRSVRVVDPDLRRIFEIPLLGSSENGVTTARINYSIAHMSNKVYLYGGLSDQNEVLESMEMFDAMTYKLTAHKYRLE